VTTREWLNGLVEYLNRKKFMFNLIKKIVRHLVVNSVIVGI